MLKDAASAAIYGARAANGVVIIKTRRGRNTGSLKFTYDGYVATQEAQDMPQRVDIRDRAQHGELGLHQLGQPPKYSPGFIDSTARGLDPVKYPNTNWLGLIYKTAPMSDQTVRLSGGNDLATLSLSANYFDQEGILNAENYYKRYDDARQHQLQHLQAAHRAGEPDADEREDRAAARRGRRAVPRDARYAADVAGDVSRTARTAGARARSTRSRCSASRGHEEPLDHDVSQHARELRARERPEFGGQFSADNKDNRR